MKLAGARSAYYEYTKTASDVTRALNFAGIAIIWVFRGEATKPILIQYEAALLAPLGCFVLSLTFDLLQYLYASAAWGLFHRRREKEGFGEEHEFKAPRHINWPSLAFFWVKIACCLAGYGFLLSYIWSTIALIR